MKQRANVGTSVRLKYKVFVRGNKQIEGEYYAQRIQEAEERRLHPKTPRLPSQGNTNSELLQKIADLLNRGWGMKRIQAALGVGRVLIDRAEGELDLGKLGGWKRVPRKKTWI